MSSPIAQFPINGIAVDVSLKPYNTFAFDYRAEYLAVVDSVDQLRSVVAWGQKQMLPITVLGGGSNLLIRGDIAGLVIINRLKGVTSQKNDSFSDVTFAAGESWHDCVAWSVEQSLGGIENLALIPGTAGAAPVQNIGAYGVEIKDVLVCVQALDMRTLQAVEIDSKACEFAYRESRFKQDWKQQYIITSITVRLSHSPKLVLEYGGLQSLLPVAPTLKDVFKTVCHIRQNKLPDPAVIANAGSFFKNPVISDELYRTIKLAYPNVVAFPQQQQWKLAAGWLIDRAGWKGHCEEGVGVFEKQALVLVNYDCDKADALRALENNIVASVKDAFGVTLEREPVLLGGHV